MKTIYVLFEGDTYYPIGGFEDFKQFINAETDEQALAIVAELPPPHRYQWRQLVAIEDNDWRHIE